MLSMGAASCIGLGCLPAAAKPELEIRKIRFVHSPALCLAPQYLAEELLRLEGFYQVEYVKPEKQSVPKMVSLGLADLTQWDVSANLPLLDAAQPVLVLAGVHAGCQELFANSVYAQSGT